MKYLATLGLLVCIAGVYVFWFESLFIGLLVLVVGIILILKGRSRKEVEGEERGRDDEAPAVGN